MTKKLLLLFLDCVLIVLAVLGGLACLRSSIPALAIPGAAVIFTTAFTVLFCALFRGKKGWIAALAVLGVMLLLTLALFEELKNSFICLLQALLTKYAKGYVWLESYIPQLAPGVTATASDALTSVALLQTYLLSLSLSRWKRLLPGALSLLLTVFLCFVLQDTPPNVTPLMLVTFAVLVMALTQGVRRRAEEEAPLALVVAVLAAGLLLALLLALFPPDEYDFKNPPVRWDTISEEIERVGAKLNNSGDATVGQGGKTRTVTLTRLTSLSDRPTPVLQVQSSRTGLVYLRGVAYAGFDGSSWQADTTFRWEKERLFPALGKRPDTEYTVKTEDTETVIFTPYELTALPDGAEVVSDAYVANTGKHTEYSLPAVETEYLIPDASEEQRQYKKWVDETCLSLPEETRAYLLDWWEKHGWGMDCTAEEVAERLSHVAEYSRTAERCPTDRDFCDWFLNDAERGYCVHYATCLTAMLRALGMPARYVSGYVTRTQAGETVQVTALNAHAWTEYYVDGGWRMLDATPRDATEFTGIIPSSDSTPVFTDDLSLPEADHRPQRPTLPERTEPPETTEPAAQTEPPSAQDPDAQPPSQDASTPWTMPTWLRVLLGAALLIALLIARRFLKRRLRERRYAAAEPNQEALLRWKRYRKLCRCLRVPPEAEWTALANKAAFSQHVISKAELAALREEIDRQERILYWSGIAKRLYYCYIRALI